MENDLIYEQQSFFSTVTSYYFSETLMERFIDYTDRKKSTIKGYLTGLRQFYYWIKENNINQPQREDIKAYREYLVNNGYSAATQSTYLHIVKLFFRWTAIEGLYPNVADNIHTAKIRHDIHKRDSLPLDDSVRLIGESIDRTTEQGKRLYCMFMIDITCGTRCVELHRANVEDIKTINNISYLYVQGKGHDDKDAPVELVPEVKEALDDYLNTRKAPRTAGMPLFTSTSNRSVYGRIATNTISTMLKNLLVSAGFDSDRLTAHSLRHTANTAAYYASGKNLYEAQKFARHQSPETTEIYIHTEDRKDRHTEQQVYDFLFSDNKEDSKRNQLLRMVANLSNDKIEDAIKYIEMLNK